jgi:tRNA1(Val) A37 N6-methylase TrmN6
VCFVYPAHDLLSAAARLRAAGLEPKRVRFVHARASRDARVVLIEAKPSKAGGLRVEPALVEREGAGYSSEMRELLDPQRAS